MRARYALHEIPPAPKERRVLILAKAKRHTRVTTHFVRGFEENGHEVLWLHTPKLRRFLGRRLGDAYMRWRMHRFRPDMVLSYAKDAEPSLWDAIPDGVPRAVFYEDALDAPHEGVLELARRASCLFTTARGQIELFQRLGVPQVRYLRTGCDLTDHHRVEPDPTYSGDVAFIGSASGDDRIALLRAIAEKHELKLYGKGWKEAIPQAASHAEVYPPEYRKICASARIILGMDPRDDVDLYFSNRTWLTLGCGGFLLTRYVPNLEEFFFEDRHLAWFSGVDECLSKIGRYLAEDGDRERVASAGNQYVRTYHTFRHATAEMMAILFGEPWDDGCKASAS